MNWLSVLTGKAMSGQVIVKYCNLPIKHMCCVASSSETLPSLDSFVLASMRHVLSLKQEIQNRKEVDRYTVVS